MTPDFRARNANVALANEVLHFFEMKLDLWTYPVRGPSVVTDLHVSASFGINLLWSIILTKRAEISARDSGV